ncbi:MAG: type II toxin-antitoxin system HicA family toxin [Dehalococcoidia bacterium]|nr:type II toxin-antitoxin system HicA family toxin [Dehalococcoidia bacterium]
MTRRALLRHLHGHGCALLREGRRHSVYWNQGARRTSTVPRHVEISEKMVQKICQDLGIPRP